MSPDAKVLAVSMTTRGWIVDAADMGSIRLSLIFKMRLPDLTWKSSGLKRFTWQSFWIIFFTANHSRLTNTFLRPTQDGPNYLCGPHLKMFGGNWLIWPQSTTKYTISCWFWAGHPAELQNMLGIWLTWRERCLALDGWEKCALNRFLRRPDGKQPL